MNACMQCPYRNRVLGKPQRAMPQVRKITFKQIVQVLCNIEIICLNVILLTCDMFLHIFFVTKSTFLVRLFRNFHVGILSIKEAIL